MFKDSLVQTGLSKKESLIYDTLLEGGVLSIAEIIKKSKLKRGIIYKTLYDLEEKGIVSKLRKDKRLHFKPNHPYKLLGHVERKTHEVRNQQLNLKAILPDLVSQFTAIESQPGVRIFEGIEGIKKVYNDTLIEGKEIWAILQTEQVEPKIYRWLAKVYAKKRAEHKIFAKVIVAKDSKAIEYKKRDKKEWRSSRLVPKNKFPIAIEVDIYGNKVAFITFRKDAEHIGIIIENELIAETMRAFFVLAWERAGEYFKE